MSPYQSQMHLIEKKAKHDQNKPPRYVQNAYEGFRRMNYTQEFPNNDALQYISLSFVSGINSVSLYGTSLGFPILIDVESLQ